MPPDRLRFAITFDCADGSLDTTFGTNGEARTTFYRWGAAAYERSDNPTYTMKVQPSDGKIIVASLFSVQGMTVPNGTPLGSDLCLVRYNANGTLDTSFGGGTVFSYGGNQNFPDNNNTIDAGKVFTTNNGHYARFNPDGSLDRSWAKIRLDVADTLPNHGELTNLRFITPFPTISGTDTRINMRNFIIRPNGKIVTAGSVGEGAISGPSGRAVVTQINSHLQIGGTFSDFKNDGKSEIAVYRGGNWYQLDSFTGNFSGVKFGSSTDKPVPADYDGDSKTDLAVYRPSNGYWYILQSSNNQFRAVLFGVSEVFAASRRFQRRRASRHRGVPTLERNLVYSLFKSDSAGQYNFRQCRVRIIGRRSAAGGF